MASVGVILWSVVEGATWRALTSVRVAWTWVFVALALAVLRDIGYVVRLMVLARGELGVKRATSSILLWELASALTPSVVGGSAVAAFILHRNGPVVGTEFGDGDVDGAAGRIVLLDGRARGRVGGRLGGLFAPKERPGSKVLSTTIFVGGYAFMAVLATFLSTALFGAPKRIRAGLESLATRRPFSRWSEALRQVASDLHNASRDLRTMSWRAWGQAAAATAVSWTARFLTLQRRFDGVPRTPDAQRRCLEPIWGLGAATVDVDRDDDQPHARIVGTCGTCLADVHVGRPAPSP